ncbi:MAG: DUF1553 domain-containing protein [Planctomycetes bacterium]|nr:DUF1553 domain-containing protein [Planctomycetota bacterium]
MFSSSAFSRYCLAIICVVGAGPIGLADDAVDLAKRIDHHLESRWASDGIKPADAADDGEFLRRISLHIGGTIPTVSESRRFLRDDSADKRATLISELLESPQYLTNFSNFWRQVMMPEGNTDLQARAQLPGFEAWLRQNLAKNTHYDAIVRELLTTPLDTGRAMNSPLDGMGTATPLGFFQSKQVKPENLAAATSRMFLGLRIECAQCHDHPQDVWKRQQFWEYAAFFAGIERVDRNEEFVGRVKEVFDRRELKIPDLEGDRVVQATFLDGSSPQWRTRVSSRRELADWITAKKNPFFARTTVNRLWAHFFGVGFVDPVDDFSGTNRPSHPELLDDIAADFAKHEFDLKYLIRAITLTRAYQLSSRRSDPSQDQPQQFARMTVQGLTGEQLFDSLATAVGYFEQARQQNAFAFGQMGPRTDFLELFATDNDAVTERQTSILQALALMNGEFTSNATSLERSSTLAAITEFPLMKDSERIEALYLAALTRKPRPDELERLSKYVESGGPSRNQKAALADLFWALLNSSEFLFNH